MVLEEMTISQGFEKVLAGAFDGKQKAINLHTQQKCYGMLAKKQAGQRVLGKVGIDYYKELLHADDLKVDDIAPEVVKAQIPLLEDYAIIYDPTIDPLKKSQVVRATANKAILEEYGYDWEKAVKAIVKKNREGFVQAFRLDVEYGAGGVIVAKKAVNPRDFDIDEVKPDSMLATGEKRFAVIPGAVMREVFNSVVKRLETGGLFKVHLANESGEVNRYITINGDLLAEFCDSPALACRQTYKVLEESMMMFAPVLGAPSNSAMVTRIKLADFTSISTVSKETAKKDGVHKSENVLKEALADSILSGRLIGCKENDWDTFTSIIDSFGAKEKLGGYENITAGSLIKYIHSLGVINYEKALTIANVQGDLDRVMRIFKAPQFMDILDYLDGVVESEADKDAYRAGGQSRVDFLKKYKRGWYNAPLLKILFWKKDGSLASALVSNDRDVLAEVYGADYARHYESFQSKFSNVSEDFKILAVMDFAKAVKRLKYYMDDEGLRYTDAMFNEIQGFAETWAQNKDEEAFMANVKRVIALENGVSYTRSETASRNVKNNSENRDMYIFRTLGGYITAGGKAEDFFKFISLAKVESISVVA